MLTVGFNITTKLEKHFHFFMISEFVLSGPNPYKGAMLICHLGTPNLSA